MRYKFIVYIAGIILLATTLYSCKNEESRTNGAVKVDILTIQAVRDAPSYNYTGVIEDSYSSMISFQVAGNIQQIYCDENQYVNKGTLLAVLNKVMHQNSYDMAQATFKQAEDAYHRLKTLHDQNSLPEIKWIETLTAFQNAQSMLNIAQTNLDNCHLYAPFSGVVSKKITETGANVMPGVPVFNLVKLETVKVKVPVPEKEVSLIDIGQKATITVTALGKDKVYTSTITEKSAMANPLSHTYDIKIELENKDRKLMPGMICDVVIHHNEAETEQIIVPNNAIMLDNDNNRFVWKLSGNTATRQSVAIGKLSSHGVIVSDGLNTGDKIIINGNQKVSEGTTIETR